MMAAMTQDQANLFLIGLAAVGLWAYLPQSVDRVDVDPLHRA